MNFPQNPSAEPGLAQLPTRCPYTFRVMEDPAAEHSPFINPKYRAEWPLPQGWQNSSTITFAMAGARSSGKSLYIAVVVKLLKRLVVENGGTFRYADDMTRRIYEEKYEKPLFEQMGLLPPTPPAASSDAHQHRPLIFALTSRQFPGKRIFLVFRDVAGEDLKEEKFGERQQELEFFRHADRVIFLYDPMAVPEIARMLEGTVPSHDVGDDDPTAVLRNVLGVLGPEARPRISLCLSKFDTMQFLAEVEHGAFYGGGNEVNWQRVMSNYGASFRRDSAPLDEAFDRDASILLDLEIRSLLSCLGANELLNQLNIPLSGAHPYPFRCFAVSALGAPPEGDRVSRTGIAPFHCLDPVREVLSEYGLFDGRDIPAAFPPTWPSSPQQPEPATPQGGASQPAHPGQAHYPAHGEEPGRSGPDPQAFPGQRPQETSPNLTQPEPEQPVAGKKKKKWWLW